MHYLSTVIQVKRRSVHVAGIPCIHLILISQCTSKFDSLRVTGSTIEACIYISLVLSGEKTKCTRSSVYING